MIERRLARSIGIAVLCAASIAGCRESAPTSPSSGESAAAVVVYVSVDEQFAREILATFEKRTGIKTKPLFDTEAGKTTGLVRRIEAERDHPRADVFWSSEVFNTITLARAGLLSAYEPPTAADVPAEYRDAAGYWTGMGLRGRVIAINTRLLPPSEAPTKWIDLAGPRWKGQVAIANPLFGTTRGHVAAMRALWGDAAFRAFLQTLHDNGVIVADGNMSAMRLVAAGEAVMCATDTDDVRVLRAGGSPVEAIYPDMGDGGTLLIPSSVAIVRGGPNPESAHRLVDYLASAEVERMLAKSDSGNIPVREALRTELGMTLPPASRISFNAIADHIDEAAKLADDILRH
jgi:iron(III) transport system substrate-binding protein